MTVKVMRGGSPVTVTVTPRKDPASSVYMIGVKFGVVRARGPVLSAVKESALLPVAVATGILTNLWDLDLRPSERRADWTGRDRA